MVPPTPRREPELHSHRRFRAFFPRPGRTCPSPLHPHVWLSPSAGAPLLSVDWPADSVLPVACGLWLACNLGCELISCARQLPGYSPALQLGKQTTKSGMHSARAGGGGGIPWRSGSFPLPGVRAKLFPAASVQRLLGLVVSYLSSRAASISQQALRGGRMLELLVSGVTCGS